MARSVGDRHDATTSRPAQARVPGRARVPGGARSAPTAARTWRPDGSSGSTTSSGSSTRVGDTHLGARRRGSAGLDRDRPRAGLGRARRRPDRGRRRDSSRPSTPTCARRCRPGTRSTGRCWRAMGSSDSRATSSRSASSGWPRRRVGCLGSRGDLGDCGVRGPVVASSERSRGRCGSLRLVKLFTRSETRGSRTDRAADLRGARERTADRDRRAGRGRLAPVAPPPRTTWRGTAST